MTDNRSSAGTETPLQARVQQAIMAHPHFQGSATLAYGLAGAAIKAITVPAQAAPVTEAMVKAGAAAMCCQAQTLGCAAKQPASEFSTCQLSTFMLDARRCLEAALAAQPPAAPVETLDALVEKITPENRHQEVGLECSSADTDLLNGLDERIDRLFLTADDGSRFVLSTESAKNIVGIVREWIRPRAQPQTLPEALDCMEWMPLRVRPIEGEVDEGEHWVIDADNVYVFKICGTFQCAERVVGALNAAYALSRPHHQEGGK